MRRMNNSTRAPHSASSSSKGLSGPTRPRHERRRSPLAILTTAAVLLSSLAAATFAPAQDSRSEGSRESTSKWVATKDGMKQVFETPEQATRKAARMAERKRKRAARHAAEKAAAAAGNTKEVAKDAAEANKATDAAGKGADKVEKKVEEKVD